MKEGINLEKQESIAYISQLMEKQKRLENLNRASKDASASLDKSQRALETYKIRIAEESAQIVKKQREQLENRLEKEIQSANRKVQQAEKKRAQEKEKQKKNHIADATQEYKERIQQTRSQIKSDMKADKIPFFCNNSVWFSLFMPTFLTDYVLLVLFLIVTGVGIPALIYALIPNHSIWQFYIIFPLCLVLAILLYIEISRRTKGAHKETLKLCRDKMNLIHELKGRIKKTEKTITKSSDESIYELKELDEKIQAARQDLEQARENQSEELNEFEQHTRLDIIQEFREKSQEKLDELTAAMEHLSKEKNLSMEMASELQLEIIDDYEDILGAENLNLSRLEQILACLEEGTADTLEQALEVLGFARKKWNGSPRDTRVLESKNNSKTVYSKQSRETADFEQGNNEVSVDDTKNNEASAEYQEDAEASAGHQEDGEISAGHQEDAEASAGHQEDGEISAGHQEDAEASAGHQEDGEVSAGHQKYGKVSAE